MTISTTTAERKHRNPIPTVGVVIDHGESVADGVRPGPRR